MPIHDAPSVPVFSYVGRLKDSRKGLELFLDALEILWDHPRQAFRAWIIGGNEDDKAWAMRSAAARPTLNSRISSGDLIFWGRVDSRALPEFYSRSTALIVPSFREQFCIVAAEAMMCGCPVIAARVGGLQDVIVEERTGNFFEKGISTSLVAVMASYLRASSLPRWHGRNAAAWAREAFNAKDVFSALENLLENPATRDCERWLVPSDIRFRRHSITSYLQKIEHLLSSEVISFDDLTSSQSLSFKAVLEDQRKVFVKIYSDRPTFLSCLHCIPYPGEAFNLPRERLLMALQLRGQSFFPPVIAHDLENGILVQEFISSFAETSQAEATKALRASIQYLRLVDPAPELLSMRETIRCRLEAHAEIGPALLEEIDRVVAELHASLVGGSLRTRRLHPQLELFRIKLFLEHNGFMLPKEYIVRAQAVINLLLSAHPLVPALPTFAHGTLKAEHLLRRNGASYLCDFDHAGYYCGPVDMAHWIWDLLLYTKGSHPGEMLKLLARELTDSTDLYLGACWILAFQLNRDIAYISRGSFTQAKETIAFLYQFPEAARRELFTR